MPRRLISKVASTQCGNKACDYSGDTAFTESEGWQAPCPKCGTMMKCGQQPKYNATHFANRRFSGSMQISNVHGFHPDEVGAVRRVMGGSAECVQDDGSVRFKDSRSEQRFRRDLKNAQRAIGVNQPTKLGQSAPPPDPDQIARMREIGVNVRE